MKNTILSFFAIALFSFANAQEDKGINLEIGTKAPLTEYRMLDVANEYQTLSSLKGLNGIIVVFSCNTCPFVVGSAKFEGWEKQYNDLAAFAKENGYSFVLVNSNQAKRDDEDSQEAMKKHAEEMGYTMPYLMDVNSAMANAFGAKTTPHVFMFDRSMKLTYKGSIDNSWDSKAEVLVPYLRQAIMQMFKGEKISFPETAPKGCSIKRI